MNNATNFRRIITWITGFRSLGLDKEVIMATDMQKLIGTSEEDDEDDE